MELRGRGQPSRERLFASLLRVGAVVAQSPLSFEELCYVYRNGYVALTGVTASFGSQSVAVLGPNGAGKSTLLGLLTTALPIQAGRFSAAGWLSTDASGRRCYQAALGVVPQSLAMFGGYRCSELLEYVAWLRRVPAKDSATRVSEALDVVGLTNRADIKIKHLSGGMRQRLALAQALVNRPRLLVLDEPTVGLDPGQRSEFRSYLHALRAETNIVMATHLVDDVAAVAEEVLILEAGGVCFAGRTGVLVSADPHSTEITGAQVEKAYLRLVRSEV